MARVKVNKFEDAGRVILNIVSRKNTRMFLSLWQDLVDNTPVDTGTARYSWILTAGSPSPRKPQYPDPHQPNYYDVPPTPDVWKYTNRWKNWYIANNQNYIKHLNDNHETARGFVDSAYRKHVILANSGGF